MRTFILRLMCLKVALAIFAGVPLGNAGYDDARKIAKQARGEGEAWSELKRPGSAHQNWQGANLEIWKTEVKAPSVPQDNLVSEAGGLDGRWNKDVLGKPVYEALVPSPKVPEERWSRVELPDYHQDIASTKKIKGVTRSRMDPGWHEGGVGDWTDMEPGPSHVEGITRLPEHQWNEGIPQWKSTMIQEKDRPIRNV